MLNDRIGGGLLTSMFQIGGPDRVRSADWQFRVGHVAYLRPPHFRACVLAG
jgi:hypothetical protein